MCLQPNQKEQILEVAQRALSYQKRLTALSEEQAYANLAGFMTAALEQISQIVSQEG